MTSYKQLGLSPFGPATFAKTELVDVDGDWAADIAVLGVPFDLGVNFRTGTRWGSKAIRDFSVRFSSLAGEESSGYWDARSGVHRATNCRIVDCGDVDIVQLMWEDNFKRITAGVRTILDRGALPVVLGGDHSITYPVVKAFEGTADPITVVHFDAHFDYRDEAAGVRYGHGNVIRRVSELPFVEKVVSLGIRSLRARKPDQDDFEADGNTVIWGWDIHANGPDYYADILPKDKTVYVTFDIDAMDPAIAPGTGTPEVGGLTYYQARRFLELVCGRNRVVGFDLVEVNPLYDPAEITGLLASQLIVEAIGFIFTP